MNKIATTVRVLITFSLLFSGVLLLSNLQFSRTPIHTWLSSLPLALAGIAFAVLQLQLKPVRAVLFRRLLLAAAFILWAIDQLLPPGRLAECLGDVVISAYCLDLYWMMRGEQEGLKSETTD
jgi:hypothetical protein